MSNRSRTLYNILGMLSIKPSSGYEIIKMIKNSTNFFWSDSDGQIYPTLAKCVTDDLATCKEEHGDNNERIKKIYSITNKGKKTLNEWLKQNPQKTLVRNEFLLKLFFAENIETDEIIKHIMDFQTRTQNQLDDLKKMHHELPIKANQSKHLKYWLLSLEFGIQTARAELLWCEDALTKLTGMKIY